MPKGGFMDTNQIRMLIKNLQIIMRCPKCSKKYGLEEIFLKGYNGSTYFLQLNCSNCKTPVNATIAISGNVAKMINNRNQKINDISKPLPDKPQHTTQTQISSDDIIEMHQFLKKFNGQFSKLF